MYSKPLMLFNDEIMLGAEFWGEAKREWMWNTVREYGA
jgi:hypothetical protein